MPVPVGRSYAPEYDFPLFEGDTNRFYIIATIPRSGSTFICHELWKTGVLGAPLEYLNFEGGMLNKASLDDLDSHLQKVRKYRTSPNGVFGLKLFPSDFKGAASVSKSFAGSLLDKSYIYLTRTDKVRQAVSYARAKQTGAWVGSTVERFAPIYTEGDVDEALEQIIVQERFWDHFFRRLSIVPLNLSYEDAAENPSRQVERIASFLRVDLPDVSSRILPQVRIQSDDLSDEWVACYKKAKGMR